MADSEVGVTRATAIACTNAVIKHLKRGLFMSELNRISESTLRFCKLAGHAQVSFEGRTNTGKWVYAVSTVVFKQDRNGQFPIEKVFVALHGPAREGFADEHIYFECVFACDDVNIKKLDKSPHEESSENDPHAKELVNELRSYGDQKQREAMIEALSSEDIQLLQAQNLTSDEHQLILDIIAPLPTHGVV